MALIRSVSCCKRKSATAPLLEGESSPEPASLHDRDHGDPQRLSEARRFSAVNSTEVNHFSQDLEEYDKLFHEQLTQPPLDIPDSFPRVLSKIGITFNDLTSPENAEFKRQVSHNKGLLPNSGALMRQCAKHGKFWALLGILRLASIYFIFPIWSYHLAACDDEATKEFGLASTIGHDTPMFLTFWLVYFPSFFFLQCKCLQAVLGIQLRSIPRAEDGSLPEIIGTNYPPIQQLIYKLLSKCFNVNKETIFWQWFVSVSTIPFFARHMAFMWNAEVAGMVFRDCDDRANSALNSKWAYVMQQSGAYRLACRVLQWDAAEAKFQNFIGVCYVLVLAQFIFVVGASIGWHSKFLPKWNAEGHPVEHDDIGVKDATLRFHTVYEWSGTNHLAVLMHQADLACFDAVTDLQTQWELKRLSIMLENVKKNGKTFYDVPSEVQIDYLYSLLSQLQRMTAKFALVGLAQNVVTANVQVSLMALLVNEMKGFRNFVTAMPMVFFNVLMCFVGTLLALGDIAALLQCQRKFKDHCMNINTVRSGHATHLLDRINKILYQRYPMYLAMYMAITVWSLCKFIAVFACESHMWNFPYCVPPEHSTG